MWKAQYYDEDCEDWMDMDEIQPSSNKQQVIDDVRHERQKCSYYYRTRVVPA